MQSYCYHSFVFLVLVQVVWTCTVFMYEFGPVHCPVHCPVCLALAYNSQKMSHLCTQM